MIDAQWDRKTAVTWGYYIDGVIYGTFDSPQEAAWWAEANIKHWKKGSVVRCLSKRNIGVVSMVGK